MTEQLEFKFFWPLTEQIPLDLDYSSCSHRTTFTILDAGNITIKSIEMPWYRKFLFKLIGFKYE